MDAGFFSFEIGDDMLLEYGLDPNSFPVMPYESMSKRHTSLQFESVVCETVCANGLESLSGRGGTNPGKERRNVCCSSLFRSMKRFIPDFVHSISLRVGEWKERPRA